MGDQTVREIMRSIASCGLAGVPRPTPMSAAGPMWPALLSNVRDERITGLAVESVGSGWLAIGDDQADQLLASHRHAMMWSLLVENKLVGLAEVFDAEGIGFAVLKGASIAHTMYPETCLRSFADLDILVRTADYARACASLERLGLRRQRPEPRPQFEERFGKASVHKDPDDGIEVDLHRTLVLGPFGLWLDPDELLAHRVTFMLGGRPIGRLDDTGMLVNVAMHAVLGWRPPRLTPLRDVLQVATVGDVDWETLARWASAWRLTAVLRHAFTTAAGTLRAEMPPAARSIVEVSPPRTESRALATYTGQSRNRGGIAIGTMRAIPGIRSKVSYARALAFPEREFLAARQGSGNVSHIRRLAVPARWLRERL
jgi:hypothetical protein